MKRTVLQLGGKLYEEATANSKAPSRQLGRALRDLGDQESAVTELAAVRRSLADLGAAPDEQQATTLIT